MVIPLAKVMVTVQVDLVDPLVLVTVTAPWKPPCHDPAVEYEAEQVPLPVLPEVVTEAEADADREVEVETEADAEDEDDWDVDGEAEDEDVPGEAETVVLPVVSPTMMPRPLVPR